MYLFICIALLGLDFLHWSTAGKNERQLLKDVLNGYETLERPVLNESHAVQVSLGLTLQQIIDVSWRDEHLQWEPDEYGGVKDIRLAPKYLWKPDILLYNSVHESFDTTYAANIIVQHDGTVRWLPPGIVISTCKIDITWFPFDVQKCGLKYGAWTHNGHLINMTVGDVDVSTYTKNGEWQLIDVVAERHEEKYECCPEPYLDITFTIKIKRRTLYYGFNLIIPCVLISLMTLLDFILPPDAGEKLTLGITIFMSLCVFLLMVADALPPTSDAVPLIGIYFCSIMVIVSASQVFTVLVLNFHYRKPTTHEMHPMIRRVFHHWLPWLLFMQRPGYVVCRGQLIRIRKHDDSIDAGSCTISESRCLLCAQYAADDVLTRVKIASGNGSYRNSTAMLADSQLPPLLIEGLANVELLLNSLLNEMRTITSKLRKENEESDIINDWKFAAAVLDRLCLVLFTTVLAVFSCGIMFTAPSLT